MISIANPIFIPEVYLAKFSFDENQNWQIVLAVYSQKIDSVLISSSTQKSICKRTDTLFNLGNPLLPPLYPLYSFYYDYLIIKNDSLNSNVNINPDGDSISITSYYKSWGDYPASINETIVFGSFRNSIIPKPLKGQSIVRILLNDYGTIHHCISDSSGNVAGMLHGHIYDKNNNLITKGSFTLSPFPIYVSCLDGSYMTDGIDINENGTYSTSLYSVMYKLNTIGICNKYNYGEDCHYYFVAGTIKTVPLNFIIKPGSSIDLDIHLLDDFVNIKQVENHSNELLKVFPNPLNDVSFHYEIGTPVRSTNCFIDLLNTNGQKIERYNILENTGDLQLPSNIANGAYLLQLWMNEKACVSIQLIVNRK
jgi:hypothetical protein